MDTMMNTTQRNRELITGIFAELAKGNVQPYRDALSDNVVWQNPGQSIWSRTWKGKSAVLDELLASVREQLVERVRLTVKRILADEDTVVVEASGQATTRTGKPYNNQYCMVYKIV